jgi:amidohydrolase
MKAINGIERFIENSTQELIAHRRWFHQHPEIAFKEQKTSDYIIAYLNSIGIHNIKTEAGTGVVCEIGDGHKVGACRFNMDALPIPEKIDWDFKSKINGYSHACGHDFELAWGLMIAKYFAENPPKNKLKLLFQPAEEEPGDEPLGRTGGQVYADMGLFNVDAIFSLHVDPEVEFGTTSIIDGEVTCAAYDFEYILQGKAGHAAKPHLAINPVFYASKLIGDLYFLEETIRKSFKDDEGFVVITPSIVQSRIDKDPVGKEESQNTIPEFVFVKGISRVRSKDATESLLKGFEAISKNYHELVSLELKLVKRAPSTLNDKNLVNFVKQSCSENEIKLIEKRTTWRDDAGWGSEKAPTAHGFVGIGGSAESRLHSPYFSPDERGLQIGLTIFLNSLIKFLCI